MDCRRMEQLVSPYLDGKLSQQETVLIESHLAACAHCDYDYRTMQRIAGACREIGTMKMTAPTGFKDGIMAMILEERLAVPAIRPAGPTRTTWKKAAAGIAAAALFALGALSMNPGSIIQIAENFPAINQPAETAPPVNTPAENGTASQNIEIDGRSPAINPTPTIAQVPPPDSNQPGVFLNKDRFIVTTMVRLEVDDTPTALEQTLQLAADVQAQLVNLGQQVGEKGFYTAVKITVARSKAPDLINRLAALGTVNSQEIDRNDITTRYADTLSQYQNLLTQRATLQDERQESSLDQRIADLASELQDWEQQAEQETIVLWLE